MWLAAYTLYQLTFPYPVSWQRDVFWHGNLPVTSIYTAGVQEVCGQDSWGAVVVAIHAETLAGLARGLCLLLTQVSCEGLFCGFNNGNFNHKFGEWGRGPVP